jgi:chromosome segregation ATPase
LEERVGEVARLKHCDGRDFSQSRFPSDHAEEIRTLNTRLQEQLATAKVNNQELEREYRLAVSGFSKVKEESGRLIGDISDLEQIAVELRTRNAQIDAEIENLQMELATTEKLEAKMGLMEGEISGKCAILQKERTCLAEEVEDLSALAQVKDRIVRELEAEERDLSLHLKGFVAKHQQVQSRARIEKENRQGMEHEIAHMKSELSHKANEVRQLQAEITTLSQRGYELSKQRGRQAEQLEEAKQSHDDRVVAKLSGDNRRIAELQEELNQTLSSISVNWKK